MNLEDLRLAIAIAGADMSIPLDDSKRLTVDGICKAFQDLASDRDHWRKDARLTDAMHAREVWLRETLERANKNLKTDLDVLREELAEMTRFRDNATLNASNALDERNTAREALAAIARCGNKACCKNCRATAAVYAKGK